jgi:20S proteasome alpha/beta subunit
MLPRPHFPPKPKPQRLPKRRAVTIGIGFHCRDGIVLAADQQQTVSGYYKLHSCKLGSLVYGGTTILWTYSYLPNLVSVMRDGMFAKLPSFPPELTLEQIADAISKQIVEMKGQYPAEMAEQQFLYAFSSGNGVRFMRVSAGIVDEPEWACIGIGDSSLVNYISKTFSFLPPIAMYADEALVLAVYMVYLAKQFVDGVGGPTDAVILKYGNGSPHFMPSQTLKRLEEKFDTIQHIFRELYNVLTNSAISKDDEERLLVHLVNSVKAFRSQ